MKLAATSLSLALATPAASAFSTFGSNKNKAVSKPVTPSFTVDNIPGALDGVGVFDPLGFADRADEALLKRYREAELAHGRVGMLAAVGFLVGEKVEGSSFLFDSQITGPAITHLAQVPQPFWIALTLAIGYAERIRLETGWIEPEKVPFDKPGQLRAEYVPGDIGFDPLNLKPKNADDLFKLQSAELQNGRLAMLAAAGFMAQELVDGKGIVEHFTS